MISLLVLTNVVWLILLYLAVPFFYSPQAVFVLGLNALHNIYSQSKISPYISYGEALEMHVSLQPFPELALESNGLMYFADSRTGLADSRTELETASND